MKQPGILVISLDFELHWGLRDLVPLHRCRDRLLGARQAVLSMLEIFSKYEIHATWATVGFLFCSSRDQLLQYLPQKRPQYVQAELSPYPFIETGGVGIDEQDDPFHYAASLVKQILLTPHQRMATHTFSHYYCLEKGQQPDDFDHDLAAAVRVALASGIKIESIVFPRNQCNPSYLPLCRKHGIQVYRGNPPHWMYQASSGQSESWVKRGMRLLDSYVKITDENCYHPQELAGNEPINIPASRFLRPYNQPLKWLEPLRLRRICRSMEHAARNGLIYHLWWHPHNFGRELPENLAALRTLLDEYARLAKMYGMISLNMEELAEYLRQTYPLSDSNHSA